MGYSEVLCHICGVSFNVARIRTSTEPRNAAWSNTGPMLDKSIWKNPMERQGSYVNSFWSECDRDAGCMFAIREIKDENRELKIDRRGKRRLGKIIEVQDEDEDGDWVTQDDEEDEPLEYSSDDEAADVEMTDASDEEDESFTREWTRNFWLEGIFETRDVPWGESVRLFNQLVNDKDGYPAWYRGVPYYITLDNKRDVVDDMFPLFNPGGSDDSEHGNVGFNRRAMDGLGYHKEDKQQVEHIAGPGCKDGHGYSGHEIGADEMRGCQTLQCLVRKPKGYQFDPLPDDEDFERTDEFFLSGLSDYMPSRDDNSPRVRPARHGCERPHAENCIWADEHADEIAMPFHPSCFEIYKRASTLSSGRIDVNALISWWSLEANFKQFEKFPRDPNVGECQHQEWLHRRGTAYLVANPLYVPKLRDIFESVIETRPDFSPRNGAFNIPETITNGSATDPFNLLPAELQVEILDYLPSKDIASLRLVSRAFCQLPVIYFQNLLLREMPWLWEAWPNGADPSQTIYSVWAALAATQANEIFERHKREPEILKDYVEMVKKEMPELAPQLDEAFPTQLQVLQDAHQLELENMEGRKPFYLPPNKTNYFALYTLVTRHWQELRGLQNRKRIWKGCEEILRRVNVYKENGQIGKDSTITGNLRGGS